MADRRTYTDQEKAEALKLYETEGPTAVEKQLGIPKATVASWARRNGVHTVRNERTREATEAASLDARARRQRIVANQHRITELIQDHLIKGEEGRGWDTLVRAAGGAEFSDSLAYVPARDRKDVLSALNSSSTIIARLDDQQTDHDDAKSVIGDLVAGLSEEYERRHQ